MNQDQALIEILNHAIELEYGALFLMPQHIARLGQSELAAGLRKAVRDELNHAEATASIIVALGGVPKADFKLLRPMETPEEMLRVHLAGEKQSIALYREAEMKASRPEHQRVLRRLLSDEERHQQMFTSLLARLEGAKDTPA